MSRPAHVTSHSTSLDQLREHLRRIEAPRSHGVLPFGIAAIDRTLPGGGLPLGAVHEVLGAGADEEDGAAAAGFIAGILARLGTGPGSAVAPRVSHGRARGGTDVSANALPLGSLGEPAPLRSMSGAFPLRLADFSRLRPDPYLLSAFSDPPALAGDGGADESGIDRAGQGMDLQEDGTGDTAQRDTAGKAGPGSGVVLWCLKRPDLYGPGLLAHGLDLARVVLVTARRGDEVLWAVEEALRAGPEAGLAAVVAEIGRLPMVAGRRLQLAAERSGVTAFLLRRWRGAAEAAFERERPSAALTRWRVTALPSASISPLPRLARGREREIADGGVLGSGVGRPRWRVDLLRVRGGAPGSWEVEIADATGHVRLSAGLADRPAAPRRPRAGSAIRRAG